MRSTDTWEYLWYIYSDTTTTTTAATIIGCVDTRVVRTRYNDVTVEREILVDGRFWFGGRVEMRLCWILDDVESPLRISWGRCHRVWRALRVLIFGKKKKENRFINYLTFSLPTWWGWRTHSGVKHSKRNDIEPSNNLKIVKISVVKGLTHLCDTNRR